MNDKRSDDTQQTGCCDQGECCPSSSCNATQGPVGGRGWWKTAVFGAVMLLAVGLMAHSILTRETDTIDATTSEAPTAPPNTPNNAPVTQGTGEPTSPEKTAGVPNNTADNLGDGKLTSIENLDGIFIDYDFVFVILPANDSQSTTKAAHQVAEAAGKIQTQGVRVGIFTLSPDNPEFASTADRWSIFLFPAVLALNKDGSGHLIAYGITETKLLQAYLGACSGSSSSCCPTSSPGSSGSCCP